MGSAVNDTTRQMGGAIGVAVFGSIMASHFSSSITDKLGGDLPRRVVRAVANNVGQAVGIARQSHGRLSVRIADAAKESFVGALHIVGVAAASITLVAVIGVVLFLPARPRDVDELTFDDFDPTPVHAGAAR